MILFGVNGPMTVFMARLVTMVTMVVRIRFVSPVSGPSRMMLLTVLARKTMRNEMLSSGQPMAENSLGASMSG